MAQQMPQWCIVLGCLTNGSKRNPEALKNHIFRFPKRKDLFKKWAEVVPYRSPHKLSVVWLGVCELHFEEKYIQRDFCSVVDDKVVKMPRSSMVTLIPGAVPSIFPDCEESPLPPQCCSAKQRLRKARRKKVNKSGTRTSVRKSVGKGPSDDDDDDDDADKTIKEEYIGDSQLSDAFLRDLRGISEPPLILKTEPIEGDDVPWPLHDAASGFRGDADPDSWRSSPFFDGGAAGGRSPTCAASETHSYILEVPVPDTPSAFAPGESCDHEVLPAAETIWIPEVEDEQDEFHPRPNSPLDNISAESELTSIADEPFNGGVTLPRQYLLKRTRKKLELDPFAAGSSECEPEPFAPVEKFPPNGSGVKILGGCTAPSEGSPGTGACPVSPGILTMMNSTEVSRVVRLVCLAPEVAAIDGRVVQILSGPKVTSKSTDIPVFSARQVPRPMRPLLPAPDIVARERKVQKLSEPKVTSRRTDFSVVSGRQKPRPMRPLLPTPDIVAGERKVQKLSEPKVTPKVTPRRTNFSNVGGQVSTMLRKLCPTPEIAVSERKIQELSEPKVAPRREDISDVSGGQVPAMLRNLLNAPGDPSIRLSSWPKIESKREIERLRRESLLERRRRYMEKVHKAQDIHAFFLAVTECCKQKCHAAIPLLRQRKLFQTFYGFGDYNKQNHFLARLMRRCEPEGAARRGGGFETRKPVLWQYHLFVDNAKRPVCKRMLNAVFQINVNRIDVVQSRLFKNKSDVGNGAETDQR